MQTNYPGDFSGWENFPRLDFVLDGVKCTVVKPLVPEAPGRPWLWRARFFGAFPFADLALLRKGWHIACTDVADLYGSPEAVRRFEKFHAFMVSRKFSPFPALVGYSRGGLAAMNFALAHPEAVCCLYLDNAVLDFKSWPGGKGKGPGSPEDWKKCLKAYGLTEEGAMHYPGNPLDRLTRSFAERTAILLVTGESDTVVPAGENAAVFVDRFQALGGDVTYIGKPGADHHPHSLSDPTPIVEFIETNFRKTVRAHGGV